MWKKILCPIDFSPGSAAAMRTAFELATESGGEVVLAHVWAAPTYWVGEPIGLMASQLADLAGTADRQLETAASELRSMGNARVTTVFRTGSPWHEIVNLAKDDPAIDLIVCGTHGRTGITHALIGSVAEKIARHAPGPVLVVRHRA